MKTIKIKQTISVEKEIEVEVTFPCFFKEKRSLPYFVAILDETEAIKIWGEKNIVQDSSGIAEFFGEEFEPIAAEKFNEEFKKVIDYLGQAACKFADGYLVTLQSIPTNEECREMESERSIL